MDKVLSRKGAPPKRGRKGGAQADVATGASPEHEASPSSRIAVVMDRAERIGLLQGKDGRIASRISSRLVRQAKERTGLTSDSKLLAFALANVALEDDFAATFAAVGGSVAPDLDLEF